MEDQDSKVMEGQDSKRTEGVRRTEDQDSMHMEDHPNKGTEEHRKVMEGREGQEASAPDLLQVRLRDLILSMSMPIVGRRG